AHDEPTGMLGIVMDITERKHAAEAMELASRLPEENPAPVVRLAEGRTVSYANAAATRLLSWSQQNRKAPAEITEIARDAHATGERRQKELSVGDGRYAVTFAPVPTGRYVNLYYTDVTERVVAEQALRASEARYRATFDNAAIGIAHVG